jgi:DNA-binding response OmpR family regulator
VKSADRAEITRGGEHRADRAGAAVCSKSSRNPGRVLTRDQLIEAAWGRLAITDRAVDTHVFNPKEDRGDSANRGFLWSPRPGYRFDI